MPWTTDKAEHRRRLAICATCPDYVLTVAGACDTCRRPRLVRRAKSDADLDCPRRSCGGSIHGKEVPRCGACGCALAIRVYASCPQGKW